MQEGLSRSRQEIQGDITSLHQDYLNKDQKGVSWAQATHLLETRNIQLRQSRDSVQEAERSLKRQWLNLIPKVGAYTSISKDLTELADISSDDISVSILSRLSIPNPFSFYGQRYGNALHLQGVKWTDEHNRRQVYTQLQGLYLSQLELENYLKQLATKTRLLEVSPVEGLVTGQREVKNLKRGVEERRDQLRNRLNRLFNTPGGNWYFTSGPKIKSYSQKLDHIRIGENYGDLGLKIQAVQLESALLGRWNIKLRRLPFLSVGATSPTIYSSATGETFDTDNLRLFASLSKSIDLTDPFDKEMKVQTERRLRYTRERLRLTLEQEVIRTERLKRQYRRTEERLQALKKESQQIDNDSGSDDLESISEQIKRSSELKNQMRSVELQLQRMDLVLLPWDESYWKKN